MALKGFTKLELTDVNTGDVEVIEHNNYVTSALEDFFKPVWAYSMQSELYYPGVLEKFFGSVQLFDSSIEGEEASTFMPGPTNRFVGSAQFGYANQTKNTWLGSYNTNESKIDMASKTATFVYDFSTAQCNGDIGCVCLAPKVLGKNPMWGVDGAIFYDGLGVSRYVENLNVRVDTSSYQALGFNALTSLYNDTNKITPLAIDLDNCFGWYYNETSNEVQKIRLNIDKASVFTAAFDVEGEVLDSHECTIAPEGATWFGASSDMGLYDDSHAYFFSYETAKASAYDGKIYMTIIDLNTGATTRTITVNNPDSTIKTSLWSYCTYQGNVMYFNGYIIFSVWKSTRYNEDTKSGDKPFFYRVNVENPTDISLATVSEGLWPPAEGMQLAYAGYFVKMPAAGRIACGSYTGNGVSVSFSCYNVELNEITPFSSQVQFHSYRVKRSVPVDVIGKPLYKCWPGISGGATYPNLSSLYRLYSFLSTINNLGQVVQKTSDKTMKITYTLQEVDE